MYFIFCVRPLLKWMFYFEQCIHHNSLWWREEQKKKKFMPHCTFPSYAHPFMQYTYTQVLSFKRIKTVVLNVNYVPCCIVLFQLCGTKAYIRSHLSVIARQMRRKTTHRNRNLCETREKKKQRDNSKKNVWITRTENRNHMNETGALSLQNKVLMIVIIYLLRVRWEDLLTMSPVSMHSRPAHSHERKNELPSFVDVH